MFRLIILKQTQHQPHQFSLDNVEVLLGQKISDLSSREQQKIES